MKISRVHQEKAAVTLPSALGNERLDRLSESKNVAVFLDYDGTLVGIVANPSKAQLSEETRRVLTRLSTVCTVAILSGRDAEDVKKLVRVRGVVCAGSHGFDIITKDGGRLADKRWLRFVAPIDRAERDLRSALAEISGVRIERKRFALAVHYRQVVGGSKVKLVRTRFSKVASSYPKLRKTEGKKVLELLPNVKWDKGTALSFLIRKLVVNSNKERRVLPIFLGDDLTDEDAFRAIRRTGVGILVLDAEGRHNTLARYTLRNPKEVRSFLSSLLEKQVKRKRNKTFH